MTHVGFILKNYTLVSLLVAATSASAMIDMYSHSESPCDDTCGCYLADIDYLVYVIELNYTAWGTTYGRCHVDVYKHVPEKMIWHTCVVEEGQRCGLMHETGCHCLEYKPPNCKFLLNFTAETALSDIPIQSVAHTYGAPEYDETDRKYKISKSIERERLFFRINGSDVLRPAGCFHYLNVGEYNVFEFFAENLCHVETSSLSMKIGSAHVQNPGPCISHGLIIPDYSFDVEIFYRESVQRFGSTVCKIYSTYNCLKYEYESANITVDAGDDLLLPPECYMSLEVDRSHTFRFCTNNLKLPSLTIKVNGVVRKTSNSACVLLHEELVLGQHVYEFSHADKCKTPKTFTCYFQGLAPSTTECIDCKYMTTPLCLDCEEGSSTKFVVMTIVFAGLIAFLAAVYFCRAERCEIRVVF